MLSLYLSMLPDDAAKSKFEALYEQHRQTMFWVAQQILQDPHMAEDAVHDAFLKILGQFENISLQNCNKTRALVVIIVRNIALDMVKKKKVQAEQDLSEQGYLLMDEANDPEQAALNQEGYERLLQALKKTKQSYVDVLILHILYDYSNQEIAELLNISPDNVRIRLHRGRKQLAQLLKEDD